MSSRRIDPVYANVSSLSNKEATILASGLPARKSIQTLVQPVARTFPRRLFVSARWRLDSTMRALSPFDLLAFLQRSREASARAASFFWRADSASFSSRRSRASARFWDWERESEAVTMSPVGVCLRVTAVETLLTCWPPGPPERWKIWTMSSLRRRVMRTIFTRSLKFCKACDGMPDREPNTLT